MIRIFLSCILFTGLHARKIDVKLTAPWPTGAISPVLEVSEFLQEEGKFWEFVKALRNNETVSILDRVESETYSEINHEQVAALAVDVASAHISSLQLAALRLTLSVRSFAPLIETHRTLATLSSHACQIPETSSSVTSWAVLQPSGRVVCKADDLLTAISADSWDHVLMDPTEGVSLDILDHVYDDIQDSIPTNTESVTLYSPLGTSEFWKFHDTILSLLSSARLSKYTFRHSIPKANTTTYTTLQGYGVNLDIKNMEYMNMDDSHASGQSDEANGDSENQEIKVEFEEGENVNGFLFATLNARKPDLGTELSKLRQELIAENSEEEEQMKVWKMKDLGIQATRNIMMDKDPLARLMEVSQNFPIYANELSRIRIDKSLKDEVRRIASSGLMNLLGNGGGAQLFVNGRAVNIGLSTFNLFSLIDTIRSETRQLSKLAQLNLPTSTSSQLLDIGIKGGGVSNSQGNPQVRIDIVSNSKGAIAFLNNLEKDPQYARWGKNLRQLLMPSWSLITLKRNLYTMIMAIDPTTQEGLTAVGNMFSLYQQMYPVRFGVVLTSSELLNEFAETDYLKLDPTIVSTADVSKGEDINDLDFFNDFRVAAAADVNILFSQAKLKLSTSTAFKFLLALSELTVGYSVDDLISCYVVTVAEASGSWSTSGIREEAIHVLLHAYTSNQESTSSQVSVSSDDSHIGFEGMLNMTRFASTKGLTINSFTLNGLPSDSLDLQSALMPLLGREQQLIQMMVHDGRLGEGSSRSRGGQDKALSDDKGSSGKVKSVLSVLMSEFNAVPRYHSFVDEAPEDMKFLLPSKTLLDSLVYLHSSGTRDSSMKTVSLVLVDDWSKPAGMKRLTAAVSFLTSQASSAERSRLAVLFSPQQLVGEAEYDGALALQTLINAVTSVQDESAVIFLANLLKSNKHYDTNIAFNTELIDRALDSSGVSEDIKELLRSAIESCSVTPTVSSKPTEDLVSLLLHELGVSRDQFGTLLLANGRSVMIGSNEVFTSEDWKLLSDVEHARSGSIADLIEVTEYVNTISDSAENTVESQCVECDWRSNAVFVSAAFVGQYTQVSRTDVSEILSIVQGDQTLLDLSSTATSSNEKDIGTVSIVVIVNPLSEAAQRVSPLLLVLRDELKLPLTVLFIPDPTLSEFPLSKFYRYVVGTDVGNLVPIAEFNELPRKHVLTMRMDVPEPWNVQSSKAIQDVDNLKCDSKLCGDTVMTSKSGGVDELTQVEYTLKSLLLAGQCFDPVEKRPPNGLQLALKRLSVDQSNQTREDEVSEGEKSKSVVASSTSDTVVMQNLGYFQLQASPGIFHLSLAEGRGKELYYIIDKHENVSSQTESKMVAITSFHDNNVPLRVKKQVGKENELLLEDANVQDAGNEAEEGSGSIFSTIGNMFSGKPSTIVKPSDDDTIHVFSLATGHLYERFLKIMMLSVVKRSSMHVKFWLFENYLSPTFKDSAIAMSEEYGFELGFVSYKWPSWLRQQTSKQRIIWGYKILFLDVLFPLNVKKVIYVDSDQTVRGDLAELWKLDLQGKPYAYTPFCSSRKETLGYQFWRQGYWKDHLKGKPYHISALYVVDLDVFRKTAVGDQLRALYDNLSRDPNSLSNLDQDLPNYAQYMIPIFSLPQEWLWCESWCSDKTKAAAKTIDLCNNPM